MFQDTRPASFDATGGIDPFAPFRIQHRGELQALLRQVRDSGAPVVLAAPGGVSSTCTLWALDAAETLVRLEPDDPLSHTNLSRILMQKGLIPEAEDAKARAMGLQMKQRR